MPWEKKRRVASKKNIYGKKGGVTWEGPTDPPAYTQKRDYSNVGEEGDRHRPVLSPIHVEEEAAFFTRSLLFHFLTHFLHCPILTLRAREEFDEQPEILRIAY